jgi:hypothetical protein
MPTPSGGAIGTPFPVDAASPLVGGVTNDHRPILALQLLRTSRENLPG